MWKLVKAFLPVGGAWWGAAAFGLLALGSGVWLGNALQSRETYRVETSFSDYKAQVAQSAAAGNARVLREMQGLQRSLKELMKEQQAKQAVDKAFSDNLIKELQNANGKSCPLSPAIVKYLDGVRNSQGAGGN